MRVLKYLLPVALIGLAACDEPPPGGSGRGGDVRIEDGVNTESVYVPPARYTRYQGPRGGAR